MPFIVSSNLDGFDQVTRKQIRSHVMRGKKMRKTNRLGTTGLVPAGLAHGQTIKIEDLIGMCTLLQPSRFGTRVYSVDFPGEIEASVLWNAEQGAWRTALLSGMSRRAEILTCLAPSVNCRHANLVSLANRGRFPPRRKGVDVPSRKRCRGTSHQRFRIGTIHRQGSAPPAGGHSQPRGDIASPEGAQASPGEAGW